LPGNGRRNREKSPNRVEAMVDDIRIRLQEQGVAPPYHVLAMSLGAMVAVAWACRHPQEIGAAVLINTSLRPFNPFYHRLKPRNYLRLLKLALLKASDSTWENAIMEITTRHPPAPTDVLKNWIAFRHENPVAAGNALRQLLAAARYRAPLARPEPPILILSSANDALVNSTCSRQLAQRWATDFAEHPSAGHDLPLDAGAWVAEQIRSWLQGLTRRSPEVHNRDNC
jgi:pimeloyl-ACP methyl ester carboxylesterase